MRAAARPKVVKNGVNIGLIGAPGEPKVRFESVHYVFLKELGASALLLCNERFLSGCFLVGCSVPLVFRSEALSSGYSIASFQLGSSFGFWAKNTLGCDPFSRVGACGRRPSESADPGARRVGSFTRAGIGCTVERKLYGGRGLGLVGGPHMPILVFQMDGFTVGK